VFNQQTDAFERCYCKLRCLFQLSKTNQKDDKASGAKQTNLITKARRVIKSSTSMFFFEQICERKSGLTLQNILKYFNLLEGQVILKNEK
jgi:hypothetical protein